MYKCNIPFETKKQSRHEDDPALDLINHIQF